jgi:pimeloyl-ACP methyl ester carboxylesterase
MTRRVVFLPGALGAAEFWHPAGALLPDAWEKVYMHWPGAGSQAPDPSVRSLDDLMQLVARELETPSDLVAQSMGGVVAVRVALKHPETIRRLVLVATSGGVDVAGLGGAEWRDNYRRNNPAAEDWITQDRTDHTREIQDITAPTLLLWGDNDPISPVAVGKHLQSLLPHARLRVVSGGTHSLALDHAFETAEAITEHLSAGLD